ncbi:MAG: hypothetical protein JO277_06980 [Candidatus Eremiobacteraeota bacterium]|nr:hypothetical protein [Candidatus Eremiobacteraeota bacterium]
MIAAVALIAALNGSWALSPSSVPGDVHLELRIDDAEHHGSSSRDVAPSSLGLTPAQLENGRHVTFSIVRDAGTFACDGWLAQGRGGGSMTFAPSAAFERAMNERDYDVTAQQQATAAMLDLSIAYVDAMASAGYPHLSFDKLVAFRALGIDDAYVRSLRSFFGSAEIDADQTISLRALRVDGAYLRDLSASGLPKVTPAQAIQLRALGIDAAYVQRVKAHGFPHPTVEDLVRLKAMKIV